MFSSDAGLYAATEILAGEDVVQKNGNLRQCKRVIVPGNAPADIAQQAVMNMNATAVVLRFDACQAFCLEERPEYVLEPFELRTKTFHDLCGTVGVARFASLEHEALNLPLHLGRRQVRKGQKVFALIVSFFRHELLTAFVVDDLRVTGSGNAPVFG